MRNDMPVFTQPYLTKRPRSNPARHRPARPRTVPARHSTLNVRHAQPVPDPYLFKRNPLRQAQTHQPLTEGENLKPSPFLSVTGILAGTSLSSFHASNALEMR